MANNVTPVAEVARVLPSNLGEGGTPPEPVTGC